MNATELKKVLEAHAEWARGTGGERAYLSGAYLRGADLSGANLRGADLSGADLSGAYLRGTDLSGANLRAADLRGAYLRGAYLRGADLSGAYLRGAYLSVAHLSGAYLSGADLRAADLSVAHLRAADLRAADLRGADLSGASLSGAYLSGADLRSAKHDDKTQWPAFLIVPETGALTGWKKLRDQAIAQLEIPADAGRVGGLVGRKCRAEFANVVAIFDRDGAPITDGVSSYARAFKYAVGDTVKPDKYDPDFTLECSSGIHFFVTRREAEEYA